MSQAKFTRKAGQDLERLWAYISKDDPDAARRVCFAILDTADQLAKSPQAGRKISNSSGRYTDVRWFVLSRFRNYLLFYKPDKDGIIVIRVIHAAQDWTRFFRPS